MSPRISLRALADHLGAEVVGDADRVVEGIRPLDRAGAEHLSFLHNPKYVEQAKDSSAGAILAREAGLLPGRDLLVCDEPYLALARALELLHPAEPAETGIHPSAAVADDAVLAEDVAVGPQAVVGARARVGAGSVLGAGVILGRGVEVGEGCLLHPRVVVEDGCVIGDRCILQAGAVVGSDGFGYATVDGVHHKVPQVGHVVLEDDVELGANVCIDRGSLGETRIGRGVKIDNLVQVAHNVQVGAGSILVSQVGVAGSTRLGRYVVMAGQSGAGGHLEVGDGAQIAAKAAVLKNLPGGAVYAGIPARPQKEWLRSQAAVAKAAELRRRVDRLERTVAELESSASEPEDSRPEE